MPRDVIELDQEIHYLSILDENGRVDEELDPHLDPELLSKMHRTMLLSRRFDERLLSWQRQGRIGTFALVQGQEAAQIGAVSAIRETDWLIPSYRETAAAVWRELPLSALIIYNAGYNEGAYVSEDARDLPIAIPVGSQLPHAVGIAYGIQYREAEDVALTFFGDGATSQGDFHEAMNFAGVLKSPLVFVCQNNQWAISVPREKQSAAKTLAQKALAYGMPGIQVDGNDVLAVHQAASEAVERARSGEGPSLVECVTYRLSLHTTADDPTKYREESEVEEWKERDPIPRLQTYMKERDLLSDEDVDRLEEEIKEQIDGAWKEATDRMEEIGAPLDMFEHIYEEMPPHLQAQREELERRLSEETGEDVEETEEEEEEEEEEE